ncbi:MAG: FAD/NAD(P)-binding oxidoreductase, partial [Coriobacteriia bacterium]|nr:FAD/NAD(P)-binding oxidoreductase [Coriobacteriia bacterium]
MTQTTAPVAIIGYGTAGVNALIGLRNAGYDGPVQVFSNTGIAPYSPILTSYYVGGMKTYEQCFPWTADDLADLRPDVLANCPVTELDPANHLIRTPQGDFPYSKCVIATGATPMCYGFPQVDGFEPLVLRTMDDAERLKTAITDPTCKRILISGASMVALKTLEVCKNRGLDVSLVGMMPHVLDRNALPQAAERFEEGLRGYGINLRLGTTVQQVEVLDENEAAEAGAKLRVTFANGDVDVFDHISVSHGMKCNLDFIPEGALEMDRAIPVDEFMRTSDPDVYAAGDVAQAYELISRSKQIVGIWKNAAVQGQVAGAAIAAELAGQQPDPKAAFKGSIATNTIEVMDLLFNSAGTMQVGETEQVEVRESDGMLVVYVYTTAGEPEGSRRLVGFNLVADHRTCDIH